MKDRLYKRVLTALLVLMIGTALVTGLQMEYEDKTHSSLKEYYVENHEETGTKNLVEAILLDYRAYDTFGEVMVLYIAIAGVLILGKKIEKGVEEREQEEREMDEENGGEGG